VLTLWRNKLRASDDPDRFFNAVRAVIAETGVIAGKQYTSTASTRIQPHLRVGPLARRGLSPRQILRRGDAGA
jgi:hypothetical protein